MVGRSPKCCLDNFTLDTHWPVMARPDEPCGRFAALVPSGPPRLPKRRFPMCYESEFISPALDRTAFKNGVTLGLSRPGKPTDKAFVVSLKRALSGRVSEHALDRLKGRGGRKIEAWRRDYYESPSSHIARLADAGRICSCRGQDRGRMNAGNSPSSGGESVNPFSTDASRIDDPSKRNGIRRLRIANRTYRALFANLDG